MFACGTVTLAASASQPFYAFSFFIIIIAVVQTYNHMVQSVWKF